MTQSFNPSPKVIPRWLAVGSILLVLVVGLMLLIPRTGAFGWVSGCIAAAFLTASTLYVVRKRFFLSYLGTLHAWMVGHLVLGSIAIVAIVFHGGISHLGTHGWLLYILAIVEFGSGLWGMYELKATPQRFAAMEDATILHPSAARSRVRILSSAIEQDLERRTPEFKEWFHSTYDAVLEERSDKLPELEGFPKGRERHASKLHQKVEEILAMHETRKRLEGLERTSRRWLYLHVPTSVAFIVLTVIHIVSRIYY